MKHSLSNKKINEIKSYLMNLYHVDTWEECINKQQPGNCHKLCKLIVKKFPGVFYYMINMVFDFSDDAQKLLYDNCDMNMYSNHYVLGIGNNLYDFARGCNCMNDIYLMTQSNNSDKYDISITPDECNLIIMSNKITL